MEQGQYYIEFDNMFTEDLSVDNLLRYKRKKIKFIKSGYYIDKAALIREIAQSIRNDSQECKTGLLKDGLTGRMSNGRFDSYNINAKKLLADNEKIYLLYLLCGTMEKTGDALGVTRQTVAEPINQYKEWLKSTKLNHNK